MTDTDSIGLEPSQPPTVVAHHWRLVLPIILLLLTVFAYWYTARMDQEQQSLLQLVQQQELLSQQMAKEAARALRVEDSAFRNLRALEAVATDTVRRLGDSVQEMTGRTGAARAQAQVSELRENWARIEGATERILADQEGVVGLKTLVDELEAMASLLTVNADRLVDALVADEADAEQIRVAGRQLMLIQRIVTNVRRVLDRGDGVLIAADRFGRDAVVFGRVNTALLNGSVELSIARVSDAVSRDILSDMGREFRRMSALIERIMDRAVKVGGMDAAALELDSLVHGVAGHTRELKNSIAAMAEAQSLPRELMKLFAAFNLIILLVAFGFMARDTRRARRVARMQGRMEARDEQARQEKEDAITEKERQAEAALVRLAGDIDRLTNGDLSVRDVSAIDDDPMLSGPLRNAVNNLRRRLLAVGDQGLSVTAAAASMHQATVRLLESGERQKARVAKATDATRQMASSVAQLKADTAGFDALASSSKRAASKVSGAVDDTLANVESVTKIAEQTSQSVRRLRSSAEQVQDLGGLIQDIGEQSRLLSLNATIQAGTGESAEALKTLANDIQRLATRARSAVRRVEEVNRNVTDDAHRALSMATRFMSAANATNDGVRLVESSATELGQLAADLKRLQQTISDAQRAHTVHVTEVVRSVTALHGTTVDARDHLQQTTAISTRLAQFAGGLERSLAGFGLPQLSDDIPMVDVLVEREANEADGRGLKPGGLKPGRQQSGGPRPDRRTRGRQKPRRQKLGGQKPDELPRSPG